VQLQAKTTTSTPGSWWKMLIRAIPASYRPELHYMRGPGPKWREKHCGSEQTAIDQESWSVQSQT
jgi:hypothetical protein